MKKFLNRILIVIILFASILLSACNKTNNDKNTSKQSVTSKVEELKFNNNSAKINYSSNLWKEVNLSAGPAIQIKSETKAVVIGASRITSTLDQDKYIYDFKNYMKNRSVDGKIEEDTLNNYPLLTYTEKKGIANITFTVLVIKDGAGYYELTFACLQDLYPNYKEEALNVMKTFTVTNPSKDKVVNDKELSEGLKTLDKAAGYDDLAVKNNLSANGIELIGTWRVKNNPKYTKIYSTDGTFRENSSEDNSNYIEGTWSYDSKKRVITHNITKAVIKGKDVTNTLKSKTINYAVKNFDKKIMYGMYLESLQLRTFIKD